MKNLVFFLNLLFLFPFFSSQGYIYLSQADISYQNANLAQNFSYVFSLESGISETDYIYIKFPFSLGTFSTSSSGPKATISLATNYNSNGVIVQALGSEDLNYFFNFKKAILANTWYKMTIMASDSSIPSQTEGFQGIIEIYTVSSLSANRIYYDSNTIFDKIQLAPYPSAYINGNCTVHKDNLTLFNDPDTISTVYFDIQITDSNKFGSVFQFIMNDISFSFISGCSLLSCISDIDYPSCTYNISYSNLVSKCVIKNSNQIDLTISTPISQSMNLRLQTYIQNPKIITQSVSTSYIIVRQINNSNSIILNAITISCGLIVNQIQMSTNIIQLFWGLEVTQSNTAGCPIVLYTLKLSSNIIPWNSIKLLFSLAKSTPLHPLLLKLDLSSSFQDLLIGSMSSNLPGYLFSKTSCELTNSQYLYCGNFSNLVGSTVYYISGKITIKSSISSSINLGGVQFIDAITSVDYTNMLYPSTSLPVLTNEEFLDFASAGVNGPASTGGGFNNMNYNQMISYDDLDNMVYNFGKADIGLGIGDVISNSPDSISAIKYPSASQASQKIIVFLAVSATQMCKNLVGECDGTGTNGDHTMLKIVFNNNILGIDSTNFTKGIELIQSIFANVQTSATIINCSPNWCSKYNTANQNSLINQIFVKTPSSTSYNSYHHVTVICQTPTGVGAQQCHQIVGRYANYGTGNNQQGFSALAFRGVHISTFPSIYADNYAFDFIFCFKYQTYKISGTNNIASIVESQWTQSASGVIPAYILTKGFYKPNLKVSWINYYAKTGELMNSDNYLPFVLRIGGSLSSSTESSSIFTGNIVAFFIGSSIDISAYKEGSLSASSDDTTNCGSNSGTSLTCRVYPIIGTGKTQSDVWTDEQRIELDYTLSSDTTFNFYIPVKPKTTSSSLTSLSMVIMTKGPSGIVINGVYRMVGSVMQNDYSFNAMTQAFTKFDNSGGFWGGVGSSQNCANSIGGSSYPNLDSSVTLKPNTNYASSFKISSQIENNNLMNCLNMQEGSEKNGWGTAFTMSSDINIFDSITSISWDFDGVIDGITTNICVLFNYKIPSTGKRVYSIICPVDTYSGISSPTIGGSYKYLLLNDIVWPWWWGDSSMPSNLIRYGWSRSDGVLVAYRSESTRVYAQNSCSNSDFYFRRLTEYNKYTMTIEPGVTIYLNSTTNFNKFFLRLTLTNTTVLNYLTFSICEFLYQNYSFTCSPVVSDSYVDFYIVYNGNDQIQINQNYYINIYLSSDNTTIDTSYYFMVYSPLGFYQENFMIDYCSSAKFQNNNSSPLDTNFVISNLSYTLSQNIISSFSFTFNTLSRNIYQGTQIKIDLGFLSLNSYGNYDLRCNVFEGYNSSILSYEWDTIELYVYKFLLLTPKTNVMKSNVFTVKCYGARVPVNINLNYMYNISGTLYQVGSKNYIQISNHISAITNLSQAYMFPMLSLTKNFSYLGLEADYFFNFLLYRGNISTDGRIVISFPKRIPSKLNPWGFHKCYLNGFLTFCELIDDHLLSVYCNMPLNYYDDQTYNLSIYGISQPNMTNYENFLDRNILFMVDDDDNITNGIIVYGEVKDNFDYMNNPAIKSIAILDLNFSNNITRDNTDSFLRIKLGPGAVTAGNAIYVKLDMSFYTALLQSFYVSCFLYNETDTNFSLNYVNQNCTKIDLLKIEIIVNTTDSTNSVPKIYLLILKNLSTPIDFILPPLPLLEIFYIISGTLYSSATGFINATFPLFNVSNSLNLYWFYYNKSNDSFVQNFNNYLDVYIGRYSSIIGLEVIAGGFNITYNYTLTGNDSSNFMIYPSYEPSNMQGLTINSFFIAGKQNALPGIYFLKFEKAANQDPLKWTSPIPPLLVNLRASRCQINTYFDVYEVPIGKTSFPIFLDYEYCSPIENVIISANITFGFNEYHLSFIDGTNLVQNLNKTINFENSEFLQIYFTVKNLDVYQNLTANLYGKVTFKLYGANADYFIAPNDIKLKLVNAISFRTPPIPSIPIVTLYKNTVGITIKCSQPSQIFYSLRLKAFESTYSYKTIEDHTSSLNQFVTTRDSSDIYWAIYGFKLQNDYSQLTLNISNLKSNGKYYFCFFCLNRFSVISPVGPNTTWSQSDNGGRITKLSFTFNNSISDTLINEISCSLTQTLRIVNSQVYNYLGKTCAISRLLTNSTNTTIITNSTNSTSNSSNLTNIIKTYSSYVFFVLPNYEISSETIQDTISTMVNSLGNIIFASTVIKNTNDISSYPLLTNFSYKIIDPQKYTPIANISNLNTTYSTVSMFISLNDSGFIFLAVNSNDSSKPSYDLLKNGLDKNGLSLSFWQILNINKGETSYQIFTNLTHNTRYYLWYALCNDDPSINSIHGGVNELVFTTNITSIKGLSGMIITFFYVFLILIVIPLL